MRSLGIRVEPSKVSFVVLEKNNDSIKIINIESIKLPKALDRPSQLKYIRNTVLDIIREYEITIAGIRKAEPISQNQNSARIEIEGVIQEAFSSSSISSYFIGIATSISKKISIKNTEYKPLISKKSSFERIENWDICKNTETKESALVGFGAML
jgi:hypothetical protein